MKLFFCVFILLSFSFIERAFADSDTGAANGAPTKLDRYKDLVSVQVERNELIEKQRARANANPEKDEAEAWGAYQNGLVKFRKGDNKSARDFFRKAIAIDATEDRYYLAYALAIERLGSYRRAVAILQMIPDGDVSNSEVRLHVALNLWKLNLNEKALDEFRALRSEDDPDFSPQASFYAGTIEKNSDDYANALTSFQYTAQHSVSSGPDVQLRNRALEQIDNLATFEQVKARNQKRWALSFLLGAGYDSNIPEISPSYDATGVAGYRFTYAAAGSYKMMKSDDRTFIVHADVSDVYSFDTGFASNAILQSADPLQATLSLPFSFWNTSHEGRLTITPAEQFLWLTNGGTNRELIFTSTYVSADWAWISKTSALTNLRLEVSEDTYHPSVTSPADNLSASKYTVAGGRTIYFDSRKRQSFSYDGLFALNDAVGDNGYYQRYQLGIGGTRPVSHDILLIGRAEASILKFAHATPLRSDFRFGGNLGIDDRLGEGSDLSLTVGYLTNSSAIDAYTYNRLTVMLTYAHSFGFEN